MTSKYVLRKLILSLLFFSLVSCTPSDREYIDAGKKSKPDKPVVAPKIKSYPKSVDISLFWGNWLEINRRLEILNSIRSEKVTSSSCFKIGPIRKGEVNKFSVTWNCSRKLSKFKNQTTVRGREEFQLYLNTNQSWDDFIKTGSYKKLFVSTFPIPSSGGQYGMHYSWPKSNREDGLYITKQNLIIEKDLTTGNLAVEQWLNFVREPYLYNKKNKKSSLLLIHYWSQHTQAIIDSRHNELLGWQTEIDHELVTKTSTNKKTSELWQYTANSKSKLVLGQCLLPQFNTLQFSHTPENGGYQSGYLSYNNKSWSFSLGGNSANWKNDSGICQHPFGFIENYITLMHPAKF